MSSLLRRIRIIGLGLVAQGVALGVALGGGLSSALPAAAEPGVTGDRILLGQSAALSGPTALLGLGMRLGLRAAFKEANDAGGVQGRQIDLISLDDGYEPDRAIDNTRKLIDDRGVFALIGAVGTPTSAAAQPIATVKGVPFIGAFTGAGLLRDPQLTYVINLRASYDQETEAWVKHLTEDLGIRRLRSSTRMTVSAGPACWEPSRPFRPAG